MFCCSELRIWSIWTGVRPEVIGNTYPLGATGVANIFEVTQHLRGRAGDRQVEGAKVGLAHVIGLGSACTINVLGT